VAMFTIGSISGMNPEATPEPAADTQATGATPTPTVTVTAPAPMPPLGAAGAQAAGDAKVAADDKAPEKKSDANPGKVTVEDGVGLDYQSAQDLWRSQGLVVTPAIDATGANRLPFIDSGWVVLDQDVSAGTQVADGSSIQATVKKYSDN